MAISPCIMSPSCLNDLAIVVVEDHDDARKYLELLLSQLGSKVAVASNGVEGLWAKNNILPDLVLSDIKMPVMDGFELLESIRALGPDTGGKGAGYRDECLFLAGGSRANT